MKHEYSRADIESYLLGRGSEEARARIAEELIVDPEFHAYVREVETEQADALVRGRLKAAEARAWREFFVATGQEDRLVVARALAEKVEPKTRAGGWLRIAAALLLTSGGVWWWTGREQAKGPVTTPLRASLVLPRDTTRGGGEARLVAVPKDAAEVELRFEVAPERAKGYRLVVQDGRGAELLVREGQGWPRDLLTVLLPAERLAEGVLELELSAVDDQGAASPVGFYRIRVKR